MSSFMSRCEHVSRMSSEPAKQDERFELWWLGEISYCCGYANETNIFSNAR